MAAVGDLVWVSLRDPSAEELASVQREFDLPGTVIQQLGAVARRPSLEVLERLVAVIKTVGWDAAEEETRSGEVQLVLGEDLVVGVERVSSTTPSRATARPWAP